MTTPRSLGGDLSSSAFDAGDAAWLEELVSLLRSGQLDEEGAHRERKEAARVFRDRLEDTGEQAQLLLTLAVLQQSLQATSGALGASYHDSLAAKNIPGALTALSLAQSTPALLRQRASEVLEQWALSVLCS
jgi:hypothetical protein